MIYKIWIDKKKYGLLKNLKIKEKKTWECVYIITRGGWDILPINGTLNSATHHVKYIPSP